MKSTITFFFILVIASFALSGFNTWVGYTRIAVVVNTTFLWTVVYVVSLISVKDIQRQMEKQRKKDRQIATENRGG